MSPIADKVRYAAFTANFGKLYAAISDVIALTEQMRAEHQVGAAFADTILLTLAKPLGLRVELGRFAQLVDLDEEGQ